MLEVKDITKDYVVGDESVHALKGVSLEFRDSEFVAILGQSGCGKTTLLNIIGGLDQYSSGDLVINGVSTKQYRDRDWDTYRNHSVGFVFQNYNLIPHQTVLSNVELALTLSGVSKAERRERAIKALEQVGLADQVNKKPNQMSGGQMQRVAIARALVNDPSIVLADEPTGALDSETSLQVMDILKEVSKDRLVIMVTHNPELAHDYASRIVRLKDGVVVDDSHPCNAVEEAAIQKEAAEAQKKGAKSTKTSMSLKTAFSLSLNNLMTKKGRTILTAFAGSIGIIGIALILSLSAGMQQYIEDMEESTMGSYPLSVTSMTMDMGSMMGAMMDPMHGDMGPNETGHIQAKNILVDMTASFVNDANKNDMVATKEWLDSNPDNIEDYVTDIQYSYKTPINIYSPDTTDGINQINPSTVFDAMGYATDGAFQQDIMGSMSAMGTGYDVWTPLLANPESLDRDFDIVAGRQAEAWNEVVILVDRDQRISDYTLFSLGLLDQEELEGLMSKFLLGKKVKPFEVTEYDNEDLLGMEFKIVPQSDLYEQNEAGLWSNMSEDERFMAKTVEDAETVKVVGIICPSADNPQPYTWGEVKYRPDLLEHLIDEVNNSAIVKDQQEHEDIDVFTGYPFPEDTDEPFTMDSVNTMVAKMPPDQAGQVQMYVQGMRAEGMTDDEIASAFERYMAQQMDNASYQGNIEKLGVADIDSPFAISIYPRDFDAKAEVDNILKAYNAKQEAAGNDDKIIHYSDVVGAMMSSVTNIVNSITYVLVAFVAISLIVSSIMIGIITYISVLERTKEIGILRSIGASKRDISRVFNAETFIIGLVAGVLGIAVTALLNIPINIIIENMTGVVDMAAIPPVAGVVLVLISVVLTFVGGLIPSRMAAKKDPVTALRTE